MAQQHRAKNKMASMGMAHRQQDNNINNSKPRWQPRETYSHRSRALEWTENQF
jgi:hypothetical protein